MTALVLCLAFSAPAPVPRGVGTSGHRPLPESEWRSGDYVWWVDRSEGHGPAGKIRLVRMRQDRGSKHWHLVWDGLELDEDGNPCSVWSTTASYGYTSLFRSRTAAEAWNARMRAAKIGRRPFAGH